MKQAKIALTATAVLAVIGGAIAFKSRVSGFDVYAKTNTTTSTTQPTPSCTVLFDVPYKTTAAGGQVLSYATSAALTSVANCPFRGNIIPAE